MRRLVRRIRWARVGAVALFVVLALREQRLRELQAANADLANEVETLHELMAPQVTRSLATHTTWDVDLELARALSHHSQLENRAEPPARDAALERYENVPTSGPYVGRDTSAPHECENARLARELETLRREFMRSQAAHTPSRVLGLWDHCLFGARLDPATIEAAAR